LNFNAYTGEYVKKETKVLKMKTIMLKIALNAYNIFYALRAGLLLVPKVTKTATRLAAHILTKLNLNSLNSRFALRQTAA